MNKAAVKKWIDALRSGDYKQGEGWLRIDDTHCVLGVLCDIHSKETRKPWMKVPIPAFLDGERYEYCGDEVGLADEVEEWIGSDLMDSLMGAENDLVIANDHGYNFDKLASMIEAHAKDLGYDE